jgi:orotate phosphoribosyltransferase
VSALPTQDETVEALERTGALRSGHFVLSSGQHSDRYCQCAALFERPEVGGRLAELLAEQIPGDARPDAVVAPALGGVLWGYDLARALGVRSLFVERHGPDRGFALRRGFDLAAGERVLMAEDVVTTGGSVLQAARVVESLGASVVGVACVVDRSGGAFAASLPEGWGFHRLCELTFAVHPPDAVPEALARVPIEEPGSRRG